MPFIDPVRSMTSITSSLRLPQPAHAVATTSTSMPSTPKMPAKLVVARARCRTDTILCRAQPGSVLRQRVAGVTVTLSTMPPGAFRSAALYLRATASACAASGSMRAPESAAESALAWSWRFTASALP